MVFTVDEMVGHFLNVGDEVAAEDLLDARLRLGWNAGPALLAALCCEGLVTASVAAAAWPTPGVWRSTPSGALTGMTGAVCSSSPATRSTASLRSGPTMR